MITTKSGETLKFFVFAKVISLKKRNDKSLLFHVKHWLASDIKINIDCDNCKNQYFAFDTLLKLYSNYYK